MEYELEEDDEMAMLTAGMGALGAGGFGGGGGGSQTIFSEATTPFTQFANPTDVPSMSTRVQPARPQAPTQENVGREGAGMVRNHQESREESKEDTSCSCKHESEPKKKKAKK